MGFIPEKTGKWDGLTDAGKLSALDNGVNWDGVSRRDKTRLFAREVDPEKVSVGIRALFFGAEKVFGKAEPEKAAGRQAYMELFRQSYPPEFQATAAKATTDRLSGLLEDYTEQANAMGLEEWKREQQAKPRNRGPELER